MKKMIGFVLAILVAFTLQACGSAQNMKGSNPGGGGGNGGGGGGGGGGGSKLNFVFTGYATGEQPVLYCAGANLDWSPIDLDASGKATVDFDWADKVACNVKIGDKWVVGMDGVCSVYSLKVNDVVVTSGANNPQNTGKNWTFNVSSAGVVTLAGDTLASLNCGTNGHLAMSVEFTGYASGLMPDVNCAGDGVTWTRVPLNVDGKTTLYGDAATYVCNIELSSNNWAVGPDGVNVAYTLKVNGVVINTGVPNGQGGYNYSFKLADNGTVTTNGSVLKTYTGTPAGSKVTLNFVFSGYTSSQAPKLYCANGGLNWTATAFDSLGKATLSADPATLVCNIQFSNGSWVVNDQGVSISYSLVVNGVVINTGTDNATDGYNYTFAVDKNGTVTTSGSLLPVYSGSGGSLLMNITFAGYRSSQTPKLYCAGQNLTWDDILLDANGQAVVSVNAGTVECNVEVEPGVWAVNAGKVWDAYTFTVNGTKITTGSNNYSFAINSSSQISGVGASLTFFGQNLYDIKFVYTGTYDITKMVLHCAGKNVYWTEEYNFSQDTNGVKSATIKAVSPDTSQYVCNVDMFGNNTIWLINNVGMISGQTLSANGVKLTKFVSNGVGSQNVAFILSATGNITLP